MEQKEFCNFKKELDDAGVALVAVSKTKPVEAVQRLYDYGQRDFGENYVQELIGKHEKLPEDIRWHFIGHLQRNKVKEIAGFIHLIHGVDSDRLIKEINKQAINHNRKIDILLQVHIADETSKFGFHTQEIIDLLPHLDLYPGLRIRGLMGMATFTDDMAQVAEEFEGLKDFFHACKRHPVAQEWDTLSMGMSADYEVAIKHGSNMIRIGTLLFGARPEF